MTLNLLRLFVAVAQHESVTEASRTLRVSQSSISHQLRLLQKNFGVKLYDRASQGITLTKEGQRFARASKSILLRLDGLQHQLIDGRQTRQQTLTLGRGRGSSEAVLSVLVAKYHKAYPLTKPVLLTDEARAIVRMVLRSQIDIGFVTFAPSSSMLAVEPFSEDAVVPFASARHPLAKKSKVTLDELAAASLIIRQGHRGKNDIEKSLRKILGPKRKLNILTRCASSEAVKLAVETGGGVGLLSLRHVKPGLKEGKLKVLEIPGLALTIKKFIIYHRQRPLSPAARDFLALIGMNKPRSRRSSGAKALGGSTAERNSHGHSEKPPPRSTV